MKRQFALMLTALLTAALLTGCGAADKNGDTVNNGTGSALMDDGIVGNDGTGSALTDDYTQNGDGTTVDPDRDGINESTVTGSNAAGTAATRDGNVLGTTTTRAGAARTATGTTRTATGTTRTATGTGTTAARQHTLVRGATYEQMLRNGYVHDTNGNLNDHENAVTPGTGY